MAPLERLLTVRVSWMKGLTGALTRLLIATPRAALQGILKSGLVAEWRSLPGWDTFFARPVRQDPSVHALDLASCAVAAGWVSKR